MEILFMLVPLGVALVSAAGAALVWALHDGQYDGLEQLGTQLPDDEP